MYWQDAKSTILEPLTTLPRLGLITDMDGTVSHIVDEPDQAQITPHNKELLAKLNPILSLTAVVSGRAVQDVAQRVGIPELVYVGNHGFEWFVDQKLQIAPAVQKYRHALEKVLEIARQEQLPGMLIEDKQATLSIHYRQAVDQDTAKHKFEDLLTLLVSEHGLSLFAGRMIFEVRPPVEINKGTVLAQLIEQYQLDAAIFMGDDTTDADALKMARQLRHNQKCSAWGLGIVADDTPAVVKESADLLLSGVPDVESFLEWLLNACQA